MILQTASLFPIVSLAAQKNYFFQKLKNSHPQTSPPESLCACCFSSHARRSFIHGMAAAAAFFPTFAFSASDPTDVLNKVHPPRPDWCEELYASVLNGSMKSYETEIAGFKSQLFAYLKGKAEKVVEIGIGTGPNLRYYAAGTGMSVLGVDPNRKMEKYARASAVAAGLPPENFNFLQAVGEAIPLSDASVDAVVGTLVLCSVKDVAMTLKEVKRVLRPGGVYLFLEHVAAKDGTMLRGLQGILDPLQQAVADGCHLTRNTGKDISEAGFSGLDSNTATLSHALFINPLLYGTASK